VQQVHSTYRHTLGQDQGASVSPAAGDAGAFSYGRISGRCWVGPGGLCVERKGLGGGARKGGGGRGLVRGRSAASRRRLLRLLSRLDLGGGCAWFCSLTWHERWAEDTGAQHGAIRAWYKRVGRCLGRSLRGALWVKEYQDRGAPHWHIVVFLHVAVPGSSVIKVFQNAWHGVAVHGGWVDKEDRAHLRYGCNVKPVLKVGRGLMCYLSKYVAKRCDYPKEGTGRTWGFWGDLPDVARDVDLCRDDVVELCRRLRRWGKRSKYLSRLNERNGFLVFGGWSLGQLIEGLSGVDTDGGGDGSRVRETAPPPHVETL
jgi:hypothetical protein